MDWFLTHAIQLLELWPAHSPDLNPIEHAWVLLKRKMRELYPDIWELKQNALDIAEFTAKLEECWQAIDQAKLDALILSLPRRLEAVRKARGWYTRY